MHGYRQDDEVCPGPASSEDMADLHSRFAVPGQDPAKPVKDGQILWVRDPFFGLPVGRVSVFLSDDGLTNINRTLPFQHVLSGRIYQQTYRSGNTWRTVTVGVGEGNYLSQHLANQVAGADIFERVHEDMRNYAAENVDGCN